MYVCSQLDLLCVDGVEFYGILRDFSLCLLRPVCVVRTHPSTAHIRRAAIV